MTIMEKRQRDLFDDDNIPELKEKKPAIPLTLERLQVVTVHYDLFSRLIELGAVKDIDYLIFRRNREGRYAPKNKYYYTVIAVRRGTPKARRVREQQNILATVDLPHKANQRRNSSQYQSLKQFCDELAILVS